MLRGVLTGLEDTFDVVSSRGRRGTRTKESVHTLGSGEGPLKGLQMEADS